MKGHHVFVQLSVPTGGWVRWWGIATDLSHGVIPLKKSICHADVTGWGVVSGARFRVHKVIVEVAIYVYRFWDRDKGSAR